MLSIICCYCRGASWEDMRMASDLSTVHLLHLLHKQVLKQELTTSEIGLYFNILKSITMKLVILSVIFAFLLTVQAEVTWEAGGPYNLTCTGLDDRHINCKPEAAEVCHLTARELFATPSSMCSCRHALPLRKSWTRRLTTFCPGACGQGRR